MMIRWLTVINEVDFGDEQFKILCFLPWDQPSHSHDFCSTLKFFINLLLIRTLLLDDFLLYTAHDGDCPNAGFRTATNPRFSFKGCRSKYTIGFCEEI